MLQLQEWAKQTGRYREGIDSEDYPTWKTRLRCALNKAPDIEEDITMRSTDSSDPYRVYRFKPAATNPGIIIVGISSRTVLRTGYFCTARASPPKETSYFGARKRWMDQ